MPAKTHGMSKTKIYKQWSRIKRRCLDEKCSDWVDYGGRGITIDKGWAEDFSIFYADMGDPPFEGATVERIDNNKGYEPNNVKWASRLEQGRNKRANVLITFKGQTKCISEWAQNLGFYYNTLQIRIKHGWSVEDALTKPVRPHGRK